MKDKSISVFLPAFNESENIDEAVKTIYIYLKKNFKDFELIVIDDGSTDDTFQKLQKLKTQQLLTKIIHHKTNQGYGMALRNGFAHSEKSLIFYTDADNQFDIRELEKVLPFVTKYDIVSAYRIKRADPLSRIFTAYVYNMLLRVLFTMPFKDVDASFKLFKKEVFDTIDLHSKTGLIDAEVLIKARKKGFSVVQVGVSHYPRKKGKTSYELNNKKTIIPMVKPSVVIHILQEMRQLWKELR